MKTKENLLSRIHAGLKDWTGSLRLLPEHEEDTKKLHFQDPYSDLDYLHDKEMERLVKALEKTQNNSARYQ